MSKNASDATAADLVVLSFLAKTPMHGYALIQELWRCEVEDWAPISAPQVYYSLRKLYDKGWTKQHRSAEGSRGPSKETYEVTRKGHAVLKQALKRSDWATKRLPNPFQTWLALAHHADADVRRSMLDARRTFLASEIEKEKKTLIGIEAETGTRNCVAYVMVSLAIRQFQAELDSLGDVERAIMNY